MMNEMPPLNRLHFHKKKGQDERKKCIIEQTFVKVTISFLLNCLTVQKCLFFVDLI